MGFEASKAFIRPSVSLLLPMVQDIKFSGKFQHHDGPLPTKKTMD